MNREARPETGAATDQSIGGDFVPLPRRQLILATVGIMLAMFLAPLSQTPHAGSVADLGGFDRYTWASTAYLVTATVATPIVGRLPDLYGHGIFFILGLIIFTFLAGFGLYASILMRWSSPCPWALRCF